ncbi:hypothetical protein POM88_026681 [Heracleum sosnowskyi]|uniref:Uncharacterized protein n=1 Tax=Heracleum sosnowskyi TaxID=360622 RepID=A0AAD8MP53_9APIA|nr:hypothetical protein POM88_026681 [Heracleum sosnowskyi]
MGSLKSFEQRTSRQSEKSVEAAFQSNLNISNPKQGENSANNQFREGRNQRSNFRNFINGKGKGRPDFSRSSSSLHCTIFNRSSHSNKDCWFKGKPKCDNVIDLVIYPRTADHVIFSKQTR